MNKLGNEFTKDYYDEETDFANTYGSYIDDYVSVFEEKADANGFEYESLYFVDDTFENYEAIRTILDKRLDEWKKTRDNKLIYN